jgi:hypothetical protein
MKTTRIVVVATILVLVLLPVLNLSARAAPEAVAPGEIMEITWIGETSIGEAGEVPEDSWVGQQLKKMFPDVRIIPMNIDQWNVDLLKILVSSGDMPDFGYYDRLQRETWNFFQDGATRSIPNDMIREHAPNMSKWYDDRPPAWLLNVVPGKDEKYALVGLKDYKLGIMYEPFFRYDWLEKIGMEPPSVVDLQPEKEPGKYFWAKHRYGFEELEAILKAFRDNDLDGNGKNDTVPWVLDKRYSRWRALQGMYGVAWGSNLEQNGETVLAEVSENAKQYLKRLAKWYEMKLINSDFPNLNSEQVRAFMHEGMAGVAEGAYSHLSWVDPATGSPRWPQALIINNPEAKLVMTDPFKGPAEFKSGTAPSYQSSSWAFNTVVAKRVSDEKLVKALEIWDYLNGTIEGHVMAIYGEPGVHFDWAGEPYKSWVSRNWEVLSTNEAMGGEEGFRFYQGGNHFPLQWMLFRDPPEQSELIHYYRETAPQIGLALYQHREDLFGETEFKSVQQRHGGDLETIHSEFFYKAVTGEIDIDSEWNDFVERYMDAGGAALQAEIEKAPLVSGLRQGKKIY